MQDKKQANIPPLRFAGFTKEWEEKFISDVCNVSTGDKNTQDRDDKGFYPFYVRSSVIERINSYTYDGEAILTAGDGDIGKVFHLAKGKFGVHQRVYMLTEINCYIQFLFQFFSAHLYERVSSLSAKNTVDSIRKDMITKMPISIPSLKEQEQIGEFFRALDELIGAKEEEMEKLRQMKAALLEAMFPNEEKQTNVNGGYKYIDIKHLPEGFYLSEGSADTPRLRFRGFTEPWQRKKLGELFTLRNGYTPSKANQKYWENGSISWFRMEDIRENGHILKDAIQKVTPEAVKGSGLFPANSFILSTTATIGEHAWIIADSLANQRFTVLSTLNRWETLDIRYFHQYCFLLGEWCKRNVNVGGLNAVNIADLINHHIPFPSLAEQERIGEFFRGQDDGIAAVGDQIERLKVMKQACLERMFA